MPLNTLGCGRYTAQVWTRGGGSLLFSALPVSSCKWDRRLDDTSEATVTLAGLGRSQKCYDAIREAKPWKHELALARDGEIVWQGPITEPQSQGTSGSYDARDLSAWWDHRKLRYDRAYSGVDLATIFQQLTVDAMTPDPTPNVVVATSDTSILGTRSYLAGQHLLIGPLLRELSDVGVDWTVVGRNVIAGGLVVPTTPIVRLNDEHLVAPPGVQLEGLAMANDVTVVGAGGGGQTDAPVFGEAIDADSISEFGLLDAVSTNSNALDATSATAGAASTLAVARRPITVASDVQLDSDAPILIQQLVPGALIEVAWRTSGIEVSGTFRLSKVSADVKGGSETVTITIQPVGTTTEVAT